MNCLRSFEEKKVFQLLLSNVAFSADKTMLMKSFVLRFFLIVSLRLGNNQRVQLF